MTVLDKWLLVALGLSLLTNFVQSLTSRYAWGRHEQVVIKYYRDRKRYPEL